MQRNILWTSNKCFSKTNDYFSSSFFWISIISSHCIDGMWMNWSVTFIRHINWISQVCASIDAHNNLNMIFKVIESSKPRFVEHFSTSPQYELDKQEYNVFIGTINIHMANIKWIQRGTKKYVFNLTDNFCWYSGNLFWRLCFCLGFDRWALLMTRWNHFAYRAPEFHIINVTKSYEQWEEIIRKLKWMKCTFKN